MSTETGMYRGRKVVDLTLKLDKRAAKAKVAEAAR
jgi:hypothetical protein